MSQELFSGGGVHVTNAFVRFRGITYSIANINSVRVGQRRAISPMALPTIVGGIVATLVVAIIYPHFLVILLCLSVVVATLMFIPKGADEAILFLKTSNGDIQAYKSSDVNLVYQMQAAIIKAISGGK